MSDDLLLSDPARSEACVGSADDWQQFGGVCIHLPAPVGRNRKSPAFALDLDPEKPPTGTRSRRREPRFHAVENRLWLQWWENGACLGRSARLVNVSRSGAMIVAWVLLREHQCLRVFLEEPAHEVGVNATVLGVVEGLNGMNQIRLGFTTPCPDPFIDAAANGFEAWLDGKRPKF